MILSEIKTGHDFYRRIWQPGEVVVGNMEERGLLLDTAVCEAEYEITHARTSALLARLEEQTGEVLNWASPKQVSGFLYDTLGLPVPPIHGSERAVKITKQGERPTSEAALQWLRTRNPQLVWLGTMLEWKESATLEKFWKLLPAHVGPDGRIHCQLAPDTETGRLNPKNPNLSAVDKVVRKAFIAPEGKKLVALDFSGLEWRILAHVLAHKYKDYSLVEEIVAGIDPHSATAVKMGLCPGPVENVKKDHPEDRDKGKILNYSINYGKTDAGLGVQIKGADGEGIGTRAGRALLDGFYEARPGIARFHKDIVNYAKAKGGVRSLLGWFRPITQAFEVRNRFGTREGPGARQAKNVIQNCATDVVWLAMLRVDGEGWASPDLRETGAELLFQNHDELVLEVDEDKAEAAEQAATEAMANCLDGVREFLCPLGVDGGIGSNWAECKGS